MSESPNRPRRQGPASAARHPLRPDHRKGKSPLVLYLAGLAVVLGLGALSLWAAGRLGGGGEGPYKEPAEAPVTTTTESSRPAATPATPPATPPAGETPGEPLPASAAAESAAAIKAAALPYPDPPSVTPETIRRVDPSRKLVAITIDDGTPFDTRLLDYLESKNVRCTTFMLGQAVKARPDLTRRLHENGWEIANHTWDHKTLTKLSDSAIRAELEDSQARISAITGNQAPYMRPPGGATSKRVEAIAAEMGFRVVLWNRSFADTSKYATPEKLFHNVMDGLEPGDIILCHWGGKSTYEAMQLIIPEMEKRGFTPVTVSELLKYSSTGAGTKVTQGGGGAGIPAEATDGTAAPARPRAAFRK